MIALDSRAWAGRIRHIGGPDPMTDILDQTGGLPIAAIVAGLERSTIDTMSELTYELPPRPTIDPGPTTAPQISPSDAFLIAAIDALSPSEWLRPGQAAGEYDTTPRKMREWRQSARKVGPYLVDEAGRISRKNDKGHHEYCRLTIDQINTRSR